MIHRSAGLSQICSERFLFIEIHITLGFTIIAFLSLVDILAIINICLANNFYSKMYSKNFLRSVFKFSKMKTIAIKRYCVQGICVSAILVFVQYCLFAQSPPYFGGGNSTGMTVTSSSHVTDTAWPANPTAFNTINGSGFDAAYYEAGRFLMQASVGFNESHVQDVLTMNIDNWIDDQFTKPSSLVLPALYQVGQISRDSCIALGGNNCDPARLNEVDFSNAWWDVNMKNEDLLRHKVAMALSEILVISRNSRLGQNGEGLSSYYDMLLTNAFGSYRDILYDTARHPSMGYYLTHANNPKTDVDANIYPDENFAREILQLFSIGLVELNTDGTTVLVGGNPIPTYDNVVVGEFSKIFTGLSWGGLWPASNPPTSVPGPAFGVAINYADFTVPMMMFDDDHEPGAKTLLNGELTLASNTGLEDLDAAIDNIMAHDNIAPFVCYRLIQRLIKSNPSPAYVGRVASIFNANSSGVKGDMKSVIKAILLDEEARDCSYQMDSKNGRLKEPMFMYSHFARMIALHRDQDNYFWNTDNFYQTATKQGILKAPSVFNFYKYNDGPKGAIQDAGLVAPEFSILTQQTSVGYINYANNWTRGSNGDKSRIFRILELDWDDQFVYWDKLAFQPYTHDTEAFINWLDRNLTVGTMSDFTRQLIRDAADSILAPGYLSTIPDDRIALAAYLTLISPDYTIIR